MSTPLVNYSESEESGCEKARKPAKRTKTNSRKDAEPANTDSDLPPLPSRFHDLYATAPRLAGRDDPSLHKGRKRATPHVEGNWPTHVFVEWHLSSPEFSTLNSVISQVRVIIEKFERQQKGVALDGPDEGSKTNKGKREDYKAGKLSNHEEETGTDEFRFFSSLTSDLGTELPLHLSLSRPNVLKTEEKAEFLDLLEGKLRKSSVRGFEVSFTGFEWASNFDGTRWFFVMKATSQQNELPTLLRLTNLSFAPYFQPPLYSYTHGVNSGFHVTIGWTLQAPTKELKETIEHIAMKEFGRKVGKLKLKAEQVKVKIGNVVNVIELGK